MLWNGVNTCHNILYGVDKNIQYVDKVDKYGGHPAPAGRALPNLINAVKTLKSTSKPRLF